MKNNTVFVDIDTQFDFMDPQGSLYVSDAEDIIKNIKKLFKYAKDLKIRIISSIDAHKIDDPEFKFFPVHCVKDTPGNQKIDASICRDKIVIENIEQDVTESMLSHEQIIIEKQSHDIFDNKNSDKVIADLDASDYVVFGVATDYCVKVAVLGLLKRGYKVSLVTDAIKATIKEGEKESLQEMKEAGVFFTNTEGVIARQTFV
ncbi:MAG: cysteine hydrolase family protein [Planctomycetota bacterium]|jgi:nicotinamidase/pyrazinamidase